MAIVRWDPFRNLDRIFEKDLPLMTLRSSVPSDLLVDVYQEDNRVVVEMHIAGMDPTKLDVSVEDNYLVVTGSKEEEREEKKRNYYYKEIQRGSFERTVHLPGNVTDDGAEATYEKGVLRVVLQKKPIEEEHKKITIKVAD